MDNVGRCNREQNCSYHYTPKQYFHDHPEIQDLHFEQSCSRDFLQSSARPSPHLPFSPSLIPDSILQSSLSNFKHNYFITFLKSIFEPTTITHLINTYFIGTSKNWPGSTVFWQIDFQGNIRDGKIMLYDPANGRRVKQPYNHITWAHSALKLKDYNLQQCFFGEHLLKLHPELPVSIVESEKTAIIASVYFPQFIWLATGGKHGCKWSSPQVSTVLKGRHITLWPDIKAYDDWKAKAYELEKSGLQVSISSLLEQGATESEREAGLDIADYLVRFKPDQFNDLHARAKFNSVLPPQITPPPHSILPPVNILSRATISSDTAWFAPTSPVVDWELDSLESFFSSVELPQPPFRLNQCTVIHNLPKFISGHMAILRTYEGNQIFLPYLQRLKHFREILISK